MTLSTYEITVVNTSYRRNFERKQASQLQHLDRWFLNFFPALCKLINIAVPYRNPKFAQFESKNVLQRSTF